MKYLADCGQPTPSRTEQARLRRYSVRVSKHRPLPGRAPFSLPPSAHSAKRTGGKHRGKRWANQTIPGQIGPSLGKSDHPLPESTQNHDFACVPKCISHVFCTLFGTPGCRPSGRIFCALSAPWGRPPRRTCFLWRRTVPPGVPLKAPRPTAAPLGPLVCAVLGRVGAPSARGANRTIGGESDHSLPGAQRPGCVGRLSAAIHGGPRRGPWLHCAALFRPPCA